jgi:hypothetical protein
MYVGIPLRMHFPQNKKFSKSNLTYIERRALAQFVTSVKHMPMFV